MADDLATCLAVLERRGLVPEPCLAAFVVGSVARGWVSPKSDYDINIISTRQWRGDAATDLRVPVEPPTVPTATIQVDGRRWELKYFIDTQVDQMLAKVSWAEFHKGLVSGQLINDSEEVFLERLVTCVPLAGEDWVQRRREELAASAFRAFVVTRSLAKADDAIEDVIGLLAANDIDSAVIAAHKAFEYTVDALLESVGEYGSWTPKWRARRFRAAAPAGLTYEDYWAVQSMRDLDPQRPGAWAERVVMLCREISMKTIVPETEPSPHRDPGLTGVS